MALELELVWYQISLWVVPPMELDLDIKLKKSDSRLCFSAGVRLELSRIAVATKVSRFCDERPAMGDKKDRNGDWLLVFLATSLNWMLECRLETRNWCTKSTINSNKWELEFFCIVHWSQSIIFTTATMKVASREFIFINRILQFRPTDSPFSKRTEEFDLWFVFFILSWKETISQTANGKRCCLGATVPIEISRHLMDSRSKPWHSPAFQQTCRYGFSRGLVIHLSFDVLISRLHLTLFKFEMIGANMKIKMV